VSLYFDVAACAGTWTGNIATAASLCQAGWHVCAGTESGLKSISDTEANAVAGCFAYNAAQDNNICFPDCNAAVEAGIDIATGIDMGGVGGGCPYHPGGASCLACGRIDSSENSGTGCDYYPSLTGVMCCLDGT
jgi:hypothetical protein